LAKPLPKRKGVNIAKRCIVKMVLIKEIEKREMEEKVSIYHLVKKIIAER